jgi:hypothetical protein
MKKKKNIRGIDAVISSSDIFIIIGLIFGLIIVSLGIYWMVKSIIGC